MTGPVLYLVFITGWLVGAFALMDLGLRCFTGQLRWKRRVRRPEGEQLEPARRPIQDVASDLHRLSRQLALVPAGTPQARRLGIQAAYDDILVEAAHLLGLPQAMRAAPLGRARDAERRRVEIALATAGMQGIF